jgi:hypothetical protein
VYISLPLQHPLDVSIVLLIISIVPNNNYKPGSTGLNSLEDGVCRKIY